MAAVAGDAVDRDALATELRPAAAAVLAAPAPLVVMVHHTLADQPGIDAGADGVDDAARLMAGDHRPAATSQAEARRGVAHGTVRVKVAAAHSRRFHGQHDLAGSGGRVGELSQLELSVAQEHDALHGSLPSERVRHVPPLLPVEFEIVEELASLAPRLLRTRDRIVASGDQLRRDLHSQETVMIIRV